MSQVQHLEFALRPRKIGMRWSLKPENTSAFDVAILEDRERGCLEIQVTTPEFRRDLPHTAERQNRQQEVEVVQSTRDKVIESESGISNPVWPPRTGNVRPNMDYVVIPGPQNEETAGRKTLVPEHQKANQAHSNGQKERSKSHTARDDRHSKNSYGKKKEGNHVPGPVSHKPRDPKQPVRPVPYKKQPRFNSSSNPKPSTNPHFRNFKPSSKNEKTVSDGNPKYRGVIGISKSQEEKRNTNGQKHNCSNEKKIAERVPDPRRIQSPVPLKQEKCDGDCEQCEKLMKKKNDDWTIVSHAWRKPIKCPPLPYHGKRNETINQKPFKPKGNRFAVFENLPKDNPENLNNSEVPVDGFVDSKRKEHNEPKKKEQVPKPNTSREYRSKNDESKPSENKKNERITGGGKQGKTQTREEVNQSERIEILKSDGKDKPTIVCKMKIPTNKLVKCCFRHCLTSTQSGFGSSDLKHMTNHLKKEHKVEKVDWVYECILDGCGAQSPIDATSTMATRWVTEHLKLKHDAVATPRIKPTKSLGNTTLEDLEKSAPSLGRPKKSTKPLITMVRLETPEKLEMKIQTRSVTKTLSTLKASMKKQEEEKKVADSQQSKSILGFFKSSESKAKGPRRSLAKCVSTDGAATNASDSVGQLLKTMTGAERVKASREMFARKSRTSLHGRPSLSAAILSVSMDEKDSKKEDEIPKEEVTPTKDDEESSTSVEIREGKGDGESEKVVVIPTKQEEGPSTFEVIPQRKDPDDVPEEKVTPVKEEEADITVTETVLSDDGSEDTHNRTYVIEEWEPVKRRFNTWNFVQAMTSSKS
ncbi:hypothetical protein CAEBREN_29622 [Caenorhabditis brenneri]|uniref:Uncharacterized protein n=1 Tax=Caenorhabditis brenneri TaxID=135651 RepID=G0N6R9_CAEBE|nr:hypothetical protein CAEBREN_29622 [Caenorhabditis brenneri]